MFQTGDLIFTQIGSPTNAISAVTQGYKGARVNHVGFVVENTLGRFVLEAFPPEVRLTHIDVYLRRSKYGSSEPRFMAGRLLPQHRHLLSEALEYGLKQRDIPYDRLYLTGEAALYCTELVVDMFKHANGGSEFFTESPMSFTDPMTGLVHDDWVNYYAYFGIPVPAGEPGSNPGDMSLDSKLNIFHVAGPITGYSP